MNITTIANSTLWRTVLTHPPRIFRCDICGRSRLFVQTDPHPIPGIRCVTCRGTSSHRAMYAVLTELFGAGLAQLRGGGAYELSAHGALHAALARDAAAANFRLTSSEYFDGVTPGEFVNGVRCENVERLTFADESFDLVTSTDVFEHVENDLTGFGEVARVLKPAGVFVFTVPFGDADTLIRAARRPDGSIEHFAAPEYHGDPYRGGSGVFTWRTYGPDIREALMAAGLHTSIFRKDVGAGVRPAVIVARHE